MGVNFSAQLVMGMPVSEDDFWQTSGTKMVCVKGHDQTSPDMQFCPSCGGKFEATDMVGPAPALEKFASDNDIESHDVAWEQLQDRARDDGELGILWSDSVQGSETDAQDMILGFQIMDIDEQGHHNSGHPMSFEEMTVKRHAILEAAEAMGLPKKEVLTAAVLHY